MARVVVFNSVTLDGYFTGENGDMSWAHKDPNDAEWNQFVGGNASGGGVLLLGRLTYDLMSSFWPTPAAMQMMPVVARGMNSMTMVLGSGSIVAQLAEAGVIDEYQVVVVPVVLGKGRTMFEGLKDKLDPKRTKTRNFGNGSVVLCYEPQA